MWGSGERRQSRWPGACQLLYATAMVPFLSWFGGFGPGRGIRNRRGLVEGSLPLITALLVLSRAAGSAPESGEDEGRRWLRRYSEKLATESADCVSCNALLPFAEHGREKRCFSHCLLDVAPGTPDSVCLEQCLLMRIAKDTLRSSQPCVALGHCPTPVAYSPNVTPESESMKYRPLVVLHGAHEHVSRVIVDWIPQGLPGIYIREVMLGDQDDAHLELSFRVLQPLDVQAQRLCDMVGADVNIAGRPVDVIGFEEGGLVARAAAQTCLQGQVGVLLTWNTPHGGHYVADPQDIVASYSFAGPARQGVLAEVLEQAGGDMYSDLVQENVAVAGYWRDPHRWEDFLTRSTYLAAANHASPQRIGEASTRSVSIFKRGRHLWAGPFGGSSQEEEADEGGQAAGSTESDRRAFQKRAQPTRGSLKDLQALVAVTCEADASAMPRTSAWFESYSVSEEGLVEVPPLFRSEMYKELELEQLDKRGALHLVSLTDCSNEQVPAFEGWSPCREEVLSQVLPHLGSPL